MSSSGGIEYVYDECPFAVNASTLRNKLTLNAMEHEQPGAKMQFYAGFLTARERGLFTLPETEQLPLAPCVRCGQPTSAHGLCAFCKLWDHQ